MPISQEKYIILNELNSRGALPENKAIAFNEMKTRGAFDAYDKELGISSPAAAQPEPAWQPVRDRPDPNPDAYLKRGVSASMPYARPLLEGIGGAAGAIVGTPLGPAGALGGGGLGYGIGAKGSDIIEEWARGESARTQPETVAGQLGQSTVDVVTGAAYEAGGQLLAGALFKLWQGGKQVSKSAMDKIFGNIKSELPAMTDEMLYKKAGEILEQHTGSLPEYEANRLISKDVMEKIPGFKATAGEMTGDPGLIKLQRSLERGEGEAGEMLLQKNAENRVAITKYLSEKFPGKEDIGTVVDAVINNRVSLEDAVIAAEKGVETAAKATPAIPPQETGTRITEAIAAEKAPVKAMEKELWEAVPDVELPTKATDAAFKSAVESPSTAQGLAKQMDSIYQQLPKTKDGLQTIDREIGSALANPATTQTERMVLGKMKSAIEADFDLMGAEAGEVGAKYKAAKEFSKTQKFDRFDRGAVSEISQRGNLLGGKKVPRHKIPEKFMNVEGAEQLIRALGSKAKAGDVMIGHYADDLEKIANPQTGEIGTKALAAWVRKNSRTLEKYGIKKSFETIEAAAKTRDAANVALKEFQDSAASKMLDADLDKALQRAFEGGGGVSAKNTGKIMSDLMEQVKKDPAALNGLENGFKNFVVDAVETAQKTLKGDQTLSPATIQKVTKRYQPAMRVLYRSKPEQYKALKMMQNAIEMQSRSVASPLGGGSDTKELSSVAASIVKKMVSSGKGVPVAGRLVGLVEHGLKAFAGMDTAQINNILIRSMYDPELARIIREAAKGTSPKIIEKRLNNYLATAGLAITKPEKRVTNE